ncbi:MAG: hypothetical protein ABJU46_03665 [Paracoccaceae bacterium]
MLVKSSGFAVCPFAISPDVDLCNISDGTILAFSFYNLGHI